MPLAALLVACTPPANDLGGDEGTATSTAGTADGAVDTTEDEPSATGVNPPLTDGTAGASTTDVGVDTDTETDTDGDPDVGLFVCELPEPCQSGYFGCLLHAGCDGEPPPVWGEGAQCVLEMLRDIRDMPGARARYDFDRGGSPDWVTDEQIYLLSSDGVVIRQILQHDSENASDLLFPPEQCALAPAEYFQGCLDEPAWDCGSPSSWVEGCVELETEMCPEP